MGYRTFQTCKKGYSHEKKGAECEDFADAYTDPDGRFFIAVVCDGHSDKNCFRSAKGARFGCEAGITVLRRFFALYCEDEGSPGDVTPEALLRLKRSIKQCWDDKVFADLRENPITEAEQEPLSDDVRGIYAAGHGLRNIYGATFLAAALCGDLFMALHIGDGILLCVSKDGVYYEPLAHDEKSDTGAPASLCDTDLFSRENAFRASVGTECPQAVLVSSDGIEDCMDPLGFKEFFHSVIGKLVSMESLEDLDNQVNRLNEGQQAYLDSRAAYYAAHGNGAEDDCSMAGIYMPGRALSEVKLARKDAEALWEQVDAERSELIRDYEKRKKAQISAIDAAARDALSLGKSIKSIVRAGAKAECPEMDAWIEKQQKIRDLKTVLSHIEKNEHRKVSFYDQKLAQYDEYIQRAGGTAYGKPREAGISVVPEEYFKEDKSLEELRPRVAEYRAKREERDRQKRPGVIFARARAETALQKASKELLEAFQEVLEEDKFLLKANRHG